MKKNSKYYLSIINKIENLEQKIIKIGWTY